MDKIKKIILATVAGGTITISGITGYFISQEQVNEIQVTLDSRTDAVKFIKKDLPEKGYFAVCHQEERGLNGKCYDLETGNLLFEF